MMFLRKKFNSLFLLLMCLFTSTLISQQYNFKNYGTKNGLAGSTINAIFQDSKGFIWFATQDQGLSRFDGKAFQNFTKKDGLIANDVTCINEDREGNIWVGTAEGISKYDGVKFSPDAIQKQLSGKLIRSIFVDDKNSIWFATEASGVLIYDGSRIKKITKDEGLSSNTVYAITQDKKGEYWFALEHGVSKYDGSQIINYDKEKGFGNKTFFSLLSDSKGNLWFGSVEGIIVMYNGKSFEIIKTPDEVSKDFIGSIDEDTHGNIWFATSHGALKYDQKDDAFTLFNEKKGLSSNDVFSITTDYEGNVWIGTMGGGVNLFSSEVFATYTQKDGLISNKIQSPIQTDNGTFIIGTLSDGISIFSHEVFTHLTSIPELNQSNTRAITVDKNNNLYIGTQDDGVFILKKQNDKYILTRHIKDINNVKLTGVFKFIQDSKGVIWVATDGSGLFKIDKDKIIQFTKSDGLITENILTLFEDSKENIWVGTLDEGVLKFENGKFINFGEKEGLANKTVWSIAEDNHHAVYFGTNGGGISCYDGKKFKTISSNDGLCSNNIAALTWDKIDNSLWVGTDKGINKIKLTPDFNVQYLRFYGDQEGFKGEEVNQNAILIDHEGLVWFGTTNGLCRYNRKFDYPTITAPKLKLNSIRLAYQTVDWKKYADSVDLRTNLPYNLKLSHRNNHLTFDFQALTTNNVKYTYILEGQDNEWSPLSTNNEANFSNIAPGKTYTFKVKAINSYGVWSDEVGTFTFTINLPWWQTWWFYLISIIIIVFFILGFIHYRTSQLAKEKKLLEEKVTERTVELKGANDKLSVAFQDIKDSINYAKKIQDAILPLDEEINKALPQSFVLFKPRDVVSGDFYWFTKKENKVFIAAVDCTGHGVPGAFMSMIGNSLLNEIVNQKGSHDAAGILKQLHDGIRVSLKQDRDSFESKDGMDLAFVVIDTSTNTLQYAGAKRPLYCFLKDEFREIKADKQSIGGLQIESTFQYINHHIDLQKGDTFYLFTDGYVDQFGGEKGKKFSSKRLKDVLAEIQNLSLAEQEDTLNTSIEKWKTGMEQIDDILIIGFRF